jgi:hypothetical protein
MAGGVRGRLAEKRHLTRVLHEPAAAAVQAQRREAWGELRKDAVPRMVRPRPHGRSAFVSTHSSKGHIDVPAVFAALEQANFPADGALSIEYEENPKDPIAEIRECVEVARAAMAAV